MRYDRIVEEYIEIIGEQLNESPVARVKDIAQARGVTLPTVSSAVEKLRELGLVKHQHYGYVTLTLKGRKLADELHSTHNAIKEMFIKVLGLSEEIADDDACKLEHFISPQAKLLLVKFIMFLKHCPFGGDSWINMFHNCCIYTEDSGSCDLCEHQNGDKCPLQISQETQLDS